MSSNILSSIDTSIFSIPSQTSQEDRVALEQIRNFISEQTTDYNYLELGSYLGGTLLPHVLSPSCSKVLSVDKRVSNQPDERRSQGYSYQGITTDDLMTQLRKNVPDSTYLNKVSTHDGVIDDLDPQLILKDYSIGFQLCFIDAEHTNEAVFSDFLHTHRLSSPDSVILLHDSWMLGSGIRNIISHLTFLKVPFFFRHLQGSVTAFFLGKYANPDQLPRSIHPGHFDQVAYFTEISNYLWSRREQEYIRNLSTSALLKVLSDKVHKLEDSMLVSS
jgi:hypothetical protein